MRFIGLMLVVALAGCATGYKADGFTGGFSEAQLGPNMWRVSFKGNGYTSADRAEEMTLLRSADVVLQAGFTHFAIVDSRSRVDSVKVGSSPSTSQTQGSVSHAYGSTYNYTATTQTQGGGDWIARMPSSSNTIVAFKGDPKQGQVYDAQFIYNSLGKKHGVVK
ncbi:MAG: CC0125/CC1285 family lipoprotein [Burkholderiales bacterium]